MTVPIVSGCVSKGIVELEHLASYSYLKTTIGSARYSNIFHIFQDVLDNCVCRCIISAN